MRTVIVIGGGPSGMMAAAVAAGNGHKVILLEKNEKLGKKLYLTGKGRCNLTNASDKDTLMSHVNVNARFLYSAFSRFGSGDVMRFFEGYGVKLKTERGRRVFPVSDHASDITKALERAMHNNGVRVLLNHAVLNIEAVLNSELNEGKDTKNADGAQVTGVKTDHGFFKADAVIVATGGLSYPSTGSTGDGYHFAEKLGHTVTPLYPSLVPLITLEAWTRRLAGLSLKNVRVTVIRREEGQQDKPVKKRASKPLYEETGELLFTHNGLSGPVILSASRFVTDKPKGSVVLQIDLKPALDRLTLDERIQRDFLENQNKQFINALDGLLPKRLIEPIVVLSGIPAELKVHAITKDERLKLGALLKALTVTPVSTAGYNEAVVTMGGVKVNEIDPSTLMSKKVSGLYFAGEVLDLDAMTGGYNLQIAFSTGYLAGQLESKFY